MKLVYAPRALHDIDEILARIQSKSPQGARSVSLAIERTVDFCALNPRAGTATNRPGIYRWPLRSYKYTIYYRHVPGSEVVEVVRVIFAPRIKNLSQAPDDIRD